MIINTHKAVDGNYSKRDDMLARVEGKQKRFSTHTHTHRGAHTHTQRTDRGEEAAAA